MTPERDNSEKVPQIFTDAFADEPDDRSRLERYVHDLVTEAVVQFDGEEFPSSVTFLSLCYEYPETTFDENPSLKAFELGEIEEATDSHIIELLDPEVSGGGGRDKVVLGETDNSIQKVTTIFPVVVDHRPFAIKKEVIQEEIGEEVKHVLNVDYSLIARGMASIAAQVSDQDFKSRTGKDMKDFKQIVDAFRTLITNRAKRLNIGDRKQLRSSTYPSDPEKQEKGNFWARALTEEMAWKMAVAYFSTGEDYNEVTEHSKEEREIDVDCYEVTFETKFPILVEDRRLFVILESKHLESDADVSIVEQNVYLERVL